MANSNRPRPGFDEVVAQIRAIAFQAVPKTISIGLVDEIAEDVAYMITHGKTLAMIPKRDIE